MEVKTIDGRGIEITPATGDYAVFDGTNYVLLRAIRDEHKGFVTEYFRKLFNFPKDSP